MKPIESNRTQPSIRDYFLCSASKRKVAPQIESPESGLDPAENPRNPLPRSQESSGAITNVERTCNTKKEIDIGWVNNILDLKGAMKYDWIPALPPKIY